MKGFFSFACFPFILLLVTIPTFIMSDFSNNREVEPQEGQGIRLASATSEASFITPPHLLHFTMSTIFTSSQFFAPNIQAALIPIVQSRVKYKPAKKAAAPSKIRSHPPES
jgi:hypothetical protein